MGASMARRSREFLWTSRGLAPAGTRPTRGSAVTLIPAASSLALRTSANSAPQALVLEVDPLGTATEGLAQASGRWGQGGLGLGAHHSPTLHIEVQGIEVGRQCRDRGIIRLSLAERRGCPASERTSHRRRRPRPRWSPRGAYGLGHQVQLLGDQIGIAQPRTQRRPSPSRSSVVSNRWSSPQRLMAASAVRTFMVEAGSMGRSAWRAMTGWPASSTNRLAWGRARARATADASARAGPARRRQGRRR